MISRFSRSAVLYYFLFLYLFPVSVSVCVCVFARARKLFPLGWYCQCSEIHTSTHRCRLSARFGVRVERACAPVSFPEKSENVIEHHCRRHHHLRGRNESVVVAALSPLLMLLLLLHPIVPHCV